MGLFIGTIAITVLLHSFAHLPPVAGMMFGLGILKLYSYALNLLWHRQLAIDEPDDVFADADLAPDDETDDAAASAAEQPGVSGKPLHIFQILERVEWDTLMFFYGVILGVGALGTLGYLALTSRALYDGLGPDCGERARRRALRVDRQRAGHVCRLVHESRHVRRPVAAGDAHGRRRWIAAVGRKRGRRGTHGPVPGAYTFMSHLRWTWAIALGYAASIVAHLVINRHLF